MKVSVSEQREACAGLADRWAETLLNAEWTLFATLTFAHCPGDEHANTSWFRWRKYVRLELLKRGPIVRTIEGAWSVRADRAPRADRRFPLWSARAIEWQKRGSIHFHALIGAPASYRETLATLHRVSLAREWQRISGGHADVQAVRTRALVVAYLAKYVSKAGGLDVVLPRSMLKPPAQAPTARVATS